MTRFLSSQRAHLLWLPDGWLVAEAQHQEHPHRRHARPQLSLGIRPESLGDEVQGKSASCLQPRELGRHEAPSASQCRSPSTHSAGAYTLPIPKYTHEVVTVWYRAKRHGVVQPPRVYVGGPSSIGRRLSAMTADTLGQNGASHFQGVSATPLFCRVENFDVCPCREKRHARIRALESNESQLGFESVSRGKCGVWCVVCSVWCVVCALATKQESAHGMQAAGRTGGWGLGYEALVAHSAAAPAAGSGASETSAACSGAQPKQAPSRAFSRGRTRRPQPGRWQHNQSPTGASRCVSRRAFTSALEARAGRGATGTGGAGTSTASGGRAHQMPILARHRVSELRPHRVHQVRPPSLTRLCGIRSPWAAPRPRAGPCLGTVRRFLLQGTLRHALHPRDNLTRRSQSAQCQPNSSAWTAPWSPGGPRGCRWTLGPRARRSDRVRRVGPRLGGPLSAARHKAFAIHLCARSVLLWAAYTRAATPGSMACSLAPAQAISSALRFPAHSSYVNPLAWACSHVRWAFTHRTSVLPANHTSAALFQRSVCS